MDPNEALNEILNLSRFIIKYATASEEDKIRLSELCLALDEWITKGGFLPERWNKKYEPESDLDIYFNK